MAVLYLQCFHINDMKDSIIIKIFVVMIVRK